MATGNKATSFWARDEDYGKRMDQQFAEGEQFLVLDIAPDTPFTDPSTGEVYESRTKMTARALDPETLTPIGLPIVVKTLSSPIYDRVKESAEGFPAVVCWRKVENKKYNNRATILEFVAPWPLPAELVEMLTPGGNEG